MSNVVRRMKTGNASARAAASAPAPAPRQQEERGRGYVRAEVKDRDGVYYEADREVELLRETFSEEDPPAHIRVGGGLTKNLGNYETLRIDVSITIPVNRARLDEGFQVASDFVADKIAEEEANWLGSGNETQKQKGKGR